MTTVERVLSAIAVIVVLAVLVAVLDVACMVALDMRLAEVPKRAVAIVTGEQALQPKPAAPAPVEATSTPKPTRATSTPIPPTAKPVLPTQETETMGRTMYVCGYDRCRDSGEYGKLVLETDINVWNSPDPDRGGVHHRASHGDKVIVVEEKRVYDGPGGLWYKLEGGGWTNDLWLTDAICTSENLPQHSFTDCLGGKY